MPLSSSGGGGLFTAGFTDNEHAGSIEKKAEPSSTPAGAGRHRPDRLAALRRRRRNKRAEAEAQGLLEGRGN